MIHFNKWFKLPGPKDLGMSYSNDAMASRLFPNNQTEKTWEDYEEYLAFNYPIRFFFAHTLPYFFGDRWRSVSRPFKNFHYWFVSHVIPSRRYHWLDLRQSDYRYGWVDTDHRMEYALFNLFTTFVERETTRQFVPSEEDAAKDDGVDTNYCGFKKQLDDHKEIMAIYNWITKERAVELEEHYRKLTQWSDARLKFADNASDLWKELKVLEERNNTKLEEMLKRILNIRHVLWT